VERDKAENRALEELPQPGYGWKKTTSKSRLMSKWGVPASTV
jgi:hypothetical protein